MSSYPTTRPNPASPQETPEGCAEKLLEYSKIISECSEYLRKYPHERDQVHKELEAQYPENPTMYDKPKEALDAMQAEYDNFLKQTSTPDSVRGCWMRMSYAFTAMTLYMSTQVLPKTGTEADFLKRWDAAYTRGNAALMAEGRVATPGPYTAPLSELLLPGLQFADKEAGRVEPESRSENTNTDVMRSRSLEEAKDLLKDVGTLLTKRFRYQMEDEMLDWRVVCVQQSLDGIQYVVNFLDSNILYDEEGVLDMLMDSVDVAHGDELGEIDVVSSQGSRG